MTILSRLLEVPGSSPKGHILRSRQRLRLQGTSLFLAMAACLILCGCNANLEGKLNPMGGPCEHDYDCESDVCAVMLYPGAPVPGEGPMICSQRCPTGAECIAGWQCQQPQDPSAEKTCFCSMSEEICDGKDNNCDAIVDNAEAANDFCIQKTGFSGSSCYNGACIGSNCANVGNCTKGWSCDYFPDLVQNVCMCQYSAEICDGKDNDCNKIIDDPTPANADCVTRKGAGYVCQNGLCCKNNVCT